MLKEQINKCIISILLFILIFFIWSPVRGVCMFCVRIIILYRRFFIWRLLAGLGFAMVAVDWLISLYYNVIISHVLLYLFASLAAIPTQLPWTSCGNWWNTEDCLEANAVLGNGTTNSTFENATLANITSRATNGEILHHFVQFKGVFLHFLQTALVCKTKKPLQTCFNLPLILPFIFSPWFQP